MIEDVQMLKQSDVLRMTGLSRTQLFKLRRAATFPAPVYLVGKKSLMRWKRTAVVEWLEATSTAAPAPPEIVDRRRRRPGVPTEPARA